MRLGELIRDSEQSLRVKGFASPRLDVDILISCALSCPRESLYIKNEEELDPELEKTCKDYINRRSLGEPVAYITEEKEFFNNTFYVNPNVLIPRPETEGVVEIALDEMRKIKLNDQRLLRVLDLGTGSGCIGLSLLKEFTKAELVAVDLSEEALAVAEKNAEDLKLSDRVHFLCQTGEKAVDGFFDIVVSNPPYISSNSSEVEDAVKKYEPHMALFAEDKGLMYLKLWSENALKLLKPSGLGVFEIGYDQGESIKEILTQNLNVTDVSVKKDLSGKDRYLYFRKKA